MPLVPPPLITATSSGGESGRAEAAAESSAPSPSPSPSPSSPSTAASDDMTGWNSLPAELRSLVLKFVIAGAQQKPKARTIASCSAVCREWQQIIEPSNFESLRVVSADLNDLESLVSGNRRSWLKRLWLKVELPRYPRRKNRIPETDDEQDANDIAWTTDITSLFEVLARWEVADCPDGLELELSARSPSDTQHMAGAAGLTEEGDSRYFDSQLDFAFLDLGWTGPHGLPLVNVVTQLSILRRCWRNVDPHAVLTLVNSLPRMAEIRYEPFQQFDGGRQEVLDMERARLVPFWPHTLRRISLFEQFDPINDEKALGQEDDGFEDYDGPEDGADQDEEEVDIDETEPRTCAALATTLTRRSLELEEMAVSFMVDARHVFRPFYDVRSTRQSELPYWPSLRWLALTSSVIHYDIDPDQLDHLFVAAARAAKRMPQLRALELWNVCKHSGGVFRFLVTGTSASITFEGTWQYSIGESVQKAFGEVARMHAGVSLEVLPAKLVQFDGQFRFLHDHLATRDLVVHDISSVEMMGKKAEIPRPQLRLR